MRQFCIALYYYSPNGYRYIRHVFHKNLPDPRTIRGWLQSVESGPGVTSTALDSLKLKAEEYKKFDKQLLVSLMKDEIYIKKKIDYNEVDHQFEGFVSCNDRNQSDELNENQQKRLPVAKTAMVYMAVGKDFKIPVAYFFLSGLNAYSSAALTQLVIKSINNTGAKVISLTQDGPRENITMAKLLGADFPNDKPYFPSPTDPNDKIYVILDPPHMLKLSRGCLKHHQLYCNGKPMHWKFIENLHRIQQGRNINLVNKLSKRHIDFHTNPMNVRIACETLSESVADCIDLLRNDGYNEFQNSEETSEYIRHNNNSFDIMNYKPSMNGAGQKFKKPLDPSTANEMFNYFKEARKYFQSIEIDETYTRKINGQKETYTVRKLAIKSRNFTPFFGFVHNFSAIEGLYMDHVATGNLDAFFTFQFSQDHLETWFSSVRSRLGNNALHIL